MNETEALTKLVNHHMWEGKKGFEWSWIEGSGLIDHDPALNEFLKGYVLKE